MFQRICKIVLPGLVLFLSACTGNYEEYNTNGADATREDMNRDNYNVIANMLQLQSNVIPTNTHLFQYMESLCGGPYGGYTADVNPSFYLKGFACYNPDPSFYGFPFNNLTTAVWPAYLALRTNSTDPVILAVADVLKVAAMHRLTDMYGPIPYSKVPEGKLETEYDSQQTVYETMIRELDDAIAVLGQHRTESFTAKADRVYNGNIGQWAKYANSLKLRLALRLAYVDTARGAQMAGEVLASEVGTLESNADNPTLPLSKTHPMRQIMVEYQNGGDARLAADITSYMNGYEDPRREKFFVPSEFDDSAIEDGYHGLRIGIEMTDQAELQKYANINMETYDGSIVWMNAAEVAFLKAEAALRGWISGPARDYYEEGIRLSFESVRGLGSGGLHRQYDAPTLAVCRSEGNLQLFGQGQHGDGRLGRGCRFRNVARADHHSEVDCELPLRGGSLGRVPQNGLSAVDERGDQQQCGGEFRHEGPPPALPAGGIHFEL